MRLGALFYYKDFKNKQDTRDLITIMTVILDAIWPPPENYFRNILRSIALTELIEIFVLYFETPQKDNKNLQLPDVYFFAPKRLKSQ